LASTVVADPYPNGELTLVATGVVTLEGSKVFLDSLGGLSNLLDDRRFRTYLDGAINLGALLVTRKFRITRDAFPGRIAVFRGDGRVYVPALLVGDRAVVWGGRRGAFFATDKPVRGAQMAAAVDHITGGNRAMLH
jgi:hypothetical protein